MPRTRIAVTALAIAGALVIVASLGGCATSASGAASSLAKAKATTLSVETKMAGFIPKSDVVSTNQPKYSKVLFSCLKKSNESYWPSTMTVSLTAGANTSNLLDEIGAYWTNKSGWSVSNTTAPDGTPAMSVVSDSGYNFTAEVAQGPVFTVTAISECFPNAGLAGQSRY